LTQGRHLGGLPEHAAPVFALDVEWPVVAGLPDDNLACGPSPDQLAYLLYTSGTTGNPKGIGITHRALVNHVLAMVQAYDLSPADRVLQFASVSFDVAVEECFPTWLAGATAARFVAVTRSNPIQAPIHVWWTTSTLAKHGKGPVDWSAHTTGLVSVDTVVGDHVDAVYSIHAHQRIGDKLAGIRAPSA